jgi:hypothetical protein
LNPNPFVNPFAAIQRFPNVAVLGQALRNQALLNQALRNQALLNNPALLNASLRQALQNQVFRDQAILNNPALLASLGLGAQNRILRHEAFREQALLINPALLNASSLGYGSLLASAASSGYGTYGYGGYYTQWMQNPYEGYLRGAASLTKANAECQQTIQQARLTREELRRSAIQTRRAWIEEAEWERAQMADPEKIRQAQLQRELVRARVSPPLTEIWSGQSLNTLLRNAIAVQGQARGQNVPLSEDTLKSINLMAGDTCGNVGLLKDNGNLRWPQPLMGEKFKEAREKMDRHLKMAARTVNGGGGAPAEEIIRDLDADWKKLNDTLEANGSILSPDQYVESKRYLKLLGDTLVALKDSKLPNYFNGTWSAKGKRVAELVKHMAEQGLWFAPATPNDEAAYLALYHALATFDASMPRSASSTNNSGSSSGYK